YITSGSDRAAISSLTQFVNYDQQTGLELRHLLSGEPLDLKLANTTHQKIASNRTDYLKEQENRLFNQIPARLRTGISENEAKELFWWLWRCLPQAAAKLLDDENLLLMPAETRIPDGSIWSHASLTAAIAGTLAGYDLTSEDVVNKWPTGKQLSHPYLVSFSFSPVKELIKASRKMGDFWAGSWILHYLSAKVCWQLAQQYGPDSLIYPSLYAQPLIDQWLLEKYPDFSSWIDPPGDQQLLTAGFPHIIILVLPKDKVAVAMQTAKSSLLKEWKEISRQVFEKLQLKENSRTWDSWLNAQWQTYYVGVPIGREDQPLISGEIYQENENIDENQAEAPEKAQSWRDKQNELYNLYDKKALFLEKEREFLQKAGELRLQNWKKYPFSSNVGSWWSSAVEQ
ncbi:MAG: type III-B CRISPR-associated protein Cas10/Cmr2, partial [Microcystis aeruginosa]